MSRRGRGGDRKSGQRYGANYPRYERVCLWCGRTFHASRPEAQTCKPAHRVALARYVKKHGQPPLFPFGMVRVEKNAPELLDGLAVEQADVERLPRSGPSAAGKGVNR